MYSMYVLGMEYDGWQLQTGDGSCNVWDGRGLDHAMTASYERMRGPGNGERDRTCPCLGLLQKGIVYRSLLFLKLYELRLRPPRFIVSAHSLPTGVDLSAMGD